MSLKTKQGVLCTTCTFFSNQVECNAANKTCVFITEVPAGFVAVYISTYICMYAYTYLIGQKENLPKNSLMTTCIAEINHYEILIHCLTSFFKEVFSFPKQQTSW